METYIGTLKIEVCNSKKKVHSISWHPDRSESTRGSLVKQRDSKLSHEIEASGEPVQDGAQTLKSHSIQKEATRIVCVLLTSNTIIRSFVCLFVCSSSSLTLPQ